MRRHVLRDVQRQRRLAHRRPRGQDEQLAAVQPAGHFIESLEAGADSADALAGIEKRADPPGKLRDHRFGRRQFLARPRLAQLHQRLFGGRQNFVRLLFADQAAVDHRLRAEDQLAQRRLVLDDANVAVQVRDLRQPVVQRNQITQPVDRFELPLLHQLVRDRDAVDLFAAVVQVLHARENAPVLFEAEIFGLKRARDLQIQVVVQQNRAEHESLSVQICGQTLGEGKFGSSHRCSRDSYLSVSARRDQFFFAPFVGHSYPLQKPVEKRGGTLGR